MRTYDSALLWSLQIALVFLTIVTAALATPGGASREIEFGAQSTSFTSLDLSLSLLLLSGLVVGVAIKRDGPPTDGRSAGPCDEDSPQAWLAQITTRRFFTQLLYKIPFTSFWTNHTAMLAADAAETELWGQRHDAYAFLRADNTCWQDDAGWEQVQVLFSTISSAYRMDVLASKPKREKFQRWVEQSMAKCLLGKNQSASSESLQTTCIGREQTSLKAIFFMNWALICCCSRVYANIALATQPDTTMQHRKAAFGEATIEQDLGFILYFYFW